MKKGYFYIIHFLIILGTGTDLFAQQLPIYSQYVQNGFMINPSMAGHDGYTSFNTTARQQWIGFKDAPKTYSFSWNMRLLKRSYRIVKRPLGNNGMLIPSTRGRVGLGAYIINDVNANLARTGGAFTYSYHIILNNHQLSFGLTAKMFQYRIYTQDLVFGESGDPVISGEFNTIAYSPDADFGALWEGRDYHVGFAVSNLLQTSVLLGSNDLPGFKTYRHYWIMGAYRIPVAGELVLEPGTLLKTSENWNPQADFSVKMYYDEVFWLGLSYRTNKSIIAMVGTHLDALYFGYSFDYALSEIGHFNYGSHEITLSLKLGSSERRFKWLNRY